MSKRHSYKKSTQKKNPVIIGIIVIVMLVGVTAGALYMLMQRTAANAATASIKDIASTQANNVGAQLELIVSDMQAITRRFEIVDAISRKGNTEVQLQALAQSIHENQRHAIHVALIPFGKADRHPLSFAELEQVKHTQRGAATPVESILGPDGKWHFIISVPVWSKDKKTIAGVLFMSYKMDRLKIIMQSSSHHQGSSSLVQFYEGIQPKIVMTIGNTPARINQEEWAPINNSRWYTIFTASPGFYKNQNINPIVLISILAGLGLTLSVVVIFLLRAANISTGSDIMETLTAPIQIASAKKISKGGKIDHDKLSDLANQVNERDEEEEGFNEISDPLFSEGMEVEESEEELPSASDDHVSGSVVNPIIFRDYDIRGDAQLYLSDEAAYAIGQAIGSEAQAHGQTRLAIAADGRTSSPRLKENLIKGIVDTGAHVIDIGEVPSPVLYFVTETTDIKSGVIVTASHNPASDNGFKIVLNGDTLADKDIQSLKNRIDTENFSKGKGTQSTANHTDDYCEKISSDIALADNLKVVVDCGNGIAGSIAPKLLEEIGCDVIPLFCDVDGNFPNHAPDPSVASNLKSLVDKVKSENADIGIALDGDGDRMVAVSPSGKIVLPDRLLMLFAKDVVSRNPGTDIIFDVKCTRKLNNLISGYGGRPLMWKSGHAHMKAKMKETGAMLGGELSGHIFFKERWYGFDDGLYAAARLLEILTIRDQNLDAALSTLPVSAITPEIRLPIAEEEKFPAIEKLIKEGDFSGGKVTTLDGLRIDFAKGWGLVRASNTGAYLTLRFEADNDEMLDKIRDLFRTQMKSLIPNVSPNF